jgi:ATP-dependent RNA helicase DHX37/DHR1
MPPKFTPRLRKQKHRQAQANEQADTNAAQLEPVSKDEKEARRQKLQEELREQHTNVSAKKQKRLDKYIVCEPLALEEWL